MKQTVANQEEWLRILTKGMVTIPKSWRDEFGLKEGKMVKARKLSDKIVIEPTEKLVPYRIYSKEELNKFVANDKLPAKLINKIENKFQSK